MRFRVLGAVEVLDDDGPVALGGPRQRLLLAVLLARRRQVVSLDALIDALWGDDQPPTARPTLQTSVSKLRRLLRTDPDVTLRTRGPGYVLDVPADAVDADRFDAEVAAAREVAARRPDEAIRALDRALDLWLGDAFAGYADQPWALPEASRLEEIRLQAVEGRNDARLALGDPDAVIGELDGLTVTHSLRERLWSQLVVALHRSGRQAEALRAAAAYRRHLRDELGLDPPPAFCELEQRVLDGDDAPRRAPSPAASIDDAPITTAGGAGPCAPVAASPLIGRESALAEVTAAVRRSRMVTLTGPGGVGKSALAAEVARRLGPGFRDGVRMVELAPVSTDDAVVASVAQAVDAERRSGRSLTRAVVDVLAARELLVVVDNCEHVTEPVGALLTELVRWCPAVTVLATSREPVGLPGEVIRPVAPLDVPAEPAAPLAELVAVPSVEVFVARATEVSPAFRLTERNAAAVAELCIHLDGLPLAIELAAARMSSMGPRELLNRLHERFALLGGMSGRTPRHRTLRDVVQWSYSALEDRERLLFDRLSVFAGGFDLDAAERTCAEDGPSEVAALLGSLVDRSLVVAAPYDDAFRYTLLETLRRFGAERLADRAEGPAVHRAHVRTYVARAEHGGAALDGRAEGEWVARLDGDLDNLRAAFGAALAVDDVDAALRLVVPVAEAGFRSIRYEVVDWAERVVATAGALEHPLGPSALAVVAYGAFVRGELSRAVDLAREALDLRDRLDTAACGLPERVLGNALIYQGQHEEAIEHLERFVEVARAAERPGRLAHAMYMRSVAQTSIGDPAGGAELAEQARAVADASGSPTARSQAAYAAGLALVHVDADGAVRLLEDASELAGSVGNRWMQAFALTESLWLRARRGEVETALAGYREVVGTWFRGGDWANQWLSLRHVAGLLAALGHDEEAALLSGAVEAAGATSALPFAPQDAEELRRLSRGLAARLGPTELARTQRGGALLREDAAVSLALQAIDAAVTGTGPSGPVVSGRVEAADRRFELG